MMAVFARVPLGELADPTDTTFVPRPEWYFLFLFQTLKFFKGSLEIVGSMVLPGLALLTLFLIPFIDRGPLVRLGKRTFAFAFAALALIAWTGLTTAAIMTTPKTTEADETAPGAESLQAWQTLSPTNCKAWPTSAARIASSAIRARQARRRTRPDQNDPSASRRRLDDPALQESGSSGTGQFHAARAARRCRFERVVRRSC